MDCGFCYRILYTIIIGKTWQKRSRWADSPLEIFAERLRR